MMQFVLASGTPFLGWAGPTSAIIIGLYVLILLVLTIALSAGAAFAVYWINKKIGIINLLRPTIDSANKTTEAALKGVAPAQYQNRIISTIAQGPLGVHTIDKQVEEYSDRVVNTIIEFQSRTLQVQTVAKAFFLPGLARRATLKAVIDERFSQIEAERLAPEIPAGPNARDGYQPTRVAAPQPRKDAAVR